MDIQARAAFIVAQSACCQARLAAMTEQNTADRAAGLPASYQPHDFENVPDQFQLGWNAVIEYLR
jgi:hypothetical protein